VDVGTCTGDEGKGMTAGEEGKGTRFRDSELPCAEIETLVRERVHVGAAFRAKAMHFLFGSCDEIRWFVWVSRGIRYDINGIR